MSALAVHVAFRLVIVVLALLVVQDLRVMFHGDASLIGDILDRLFGFETSARIVTYSHAFVLGGLTGVQQVTALLRSGISPRTILAHQLGRPTYLSSDRETRERMLARSRR